MWGFIHNILYFLLFAFFKCGSIIKKPDHPALVPEQGSRVAQKNHYKNWPLSQIRDSPQQALMKDQSLLSFQSVGVLNCSRKTIQELTN